MRHMDECQSSTVEKGVTLSRFTPEAHTLSHVVLVKKPLFVF